MSERNAAPVYRVCAGTGEGQWQVFRNAASEAMATFTDKTEALSYAMNLARGHTPALHLLLPRAQRPARSGLGVAHRAFNA